MKPFKLIFALAVIVLAAVALSGCGGSSSQQITTPWNGTVAGMDTNPPNNDVGVGLDTWIEVFWPGPESPPPSFTFRLYKGTDSGWDLVSTIFKSQDSYPVATDQGSWWFAPEHNLSSFTDYKIVVIDDLGNSATHYFTTGSTTATALTSRSAARVYKPKGGGTPGGTAADEQVIKTRR